MDPRKRLVAGAAAAARPGAESTPPILRSRAGARGGDGNGSFSSAASAFSSAYGKAAGAGAGAGAAGDGAGAGGAGAKEPRSDAEKHLFERDLYAKETINVARTESGNLLSDVAIDGAGGLSVGFGSQHPFVIVINPLHPLQTERSANDDDSPASSSSTATSDPIGHSSPLSIEVNFFRSGEEFLNACRELLRKSVETLFWIDADLSVLSATQQAAFFKLFRFNQITQADCMSEDRYVSDTRLALYQRYLFCIVDAVDDIATVSTSADLAPTPQFRASGQHDSAPNQSGGMWITKNLNILLFDRGVVSVHLQGIDISDDVIGRINTGRGVIPSCGWLLWCLLDVMTDSMAPLLDSSVSTADAIDHASVSLSSLDTLPSLSGSRSRSRNPSARRAFCASCGRQPSNHETGNEASRGGSVESSHAGAFLLKMGKARRDLERLKASYMSKQELVEKLQSDAVGRFRGDINFHLASLLSQIKWKLQRTDMAQLNLKSAYQNYVTCVSLASAAAAGKANETTKSLTLLLAITTPLNLVASIMGMNVYPLNVIFVGEDVDSETPWVFVAVLLSFALITAILFVVAKLACGLRLC